jgi:hypothetical protein
VIPSRYSRHLEPMEALCHHSSKTKNCCDDGSEQQTEISLDVSSNFANICFNFAYIPLYMADIGFYLCNSRFHPRIMGTRSARCKRGLLSAG